MSHPRWNVVVLYIKDDDTLIPVQHEIEELEELQELIEAKRAKITALQRLKKSLMQNLLTGRMRLSPEAIAELTAEKAL